LTSGERKEEGGVRAAAALSRDAGHATVRVDRERLDCAVRVLVRGIQDVLVCRTQGDPRRVRVRVGLRNIFDGAGRRVEGVGHNGGCVTAGKDGVRWDMVQDGFNVRENGYVQVPVEVGVEEEDVAVEVETVEMLEGDDEEDDDDEVDVLLRHWL
jgi:hypothetical protein